jgi:hypothetical protein
MHTLRHRKDALLAHACSHTRDEHADARRLNAFLTHHVCLPACPAPTTRTHHHHHHLYTLSAHIQAHTPTSNVNALQHPGCPAPPTTCL